MFSRSKGIDLPAMKRALIIVLLAALSVIACGCFGEVKNQGVRRISNATISVPGNRHPGEVIMFRVTDSKLLEDLLARPLRQAVNSQPADYAYLGELSIDYHDGGTQTMHLFLPFGMFEQGDAYKLADLSALENELRQSIEHVNSVFTSAAGASN